MAKSVSFNKREIEKKKQSKRKEKEERKLQRKASGGSGSFEDMIAYVDENGMITDTPPDPNRKKIEVDLEDIAVSTPKKEETENTVPTGHVDYFNADKGYGFIKGGGGPADKYFFHISNAPEDIAEGNKVTFELERGPKGINAVNITIIK